MASKPETGIFLERRGYRRRRLLDGLKFLPFLGAWLFLLPILWPEGEGTRPMSAALVYLFVVWTGVALLCGALFFAHGRLDQGEEDRPDEDTP